MFHTWQAAENALRETELEGKIPVYYVNWMCMKNKFFPLSSLPSLEKSSINKHTVTSREHI